MNTSMTINVSEASSFPSVPLKVSVSKRAKVQTILVTDPGIFFTKMVPLCAFKSTKLAVILVLKCAK